MAELTITQVLEHYGADLTRVRPYGWRSIKCPFHGDRMASASVNLEKGAFACHACGMKGDAISLIKRNEKLDYRSALEFAERELGSVVSGLRGTIRDRKPERRQRWRDRLL